MTIKEAFEKLTANMSASLRNPFFVGRTLHDTFADIADKIEEGGGSSSAEDVSYDNTDSGLNADDVQAAIDEVVDLIPKISYSTTEQKTGLKWIDGKDIYQITIVNSNIATLESGSFSTTLSGIDTVMEINGYIKEGTNFFAIPYGSAWQSNPRTVGVSFNTSDNKLYVSGNDTFSNADLVVTLNYTKSA